MRIPLSSTNEVQLSSLLAFSPGKHGPVLGLLGLYLLFSIFTDNFLSVSNQINVLQQSSIIGVLAVGMSFAIFCGEIDLSIAEVMEFIGLLIAALATGAAMLPQVSPVLAIVVGFTVGISLGAVSGFITSRLDVPSFMTTLAVLFLASGLGLMASNNRPILSLPNELTVLGSGEVFGIPTLVLVFLFCLVLGQIVLSYTRFGQHLYAVGGDREAASKMGIKVQRVRMGVLLISAGFTSLAALLMLGRLGSAVPTMGTGFLLPPIAAVVLGGADLFGGDGHLGRTLVGVLILGVLENGLNLMGLGEEVQLVAQGTVLLLAVIVNVISE